MKNLLALALVLPGTYAFPSAIGFTGQGLEDINELNARASSGGCSVSAECDKYIKIPKSRLKVNRAGQALSQGRTNCGVASQCLTFDAKDQYVSTSGAHKYIKPTAKQIRGPCPGLNAAANHGYLPRTGVSSIADTILGLTAMYAMGPDVSGFLAVYSIVFDGDALTQTWSIGGPPPYIGGLSRAPQGITWSHNKYEGDDSVTRCDAYLNNGDAHSLSTTKFRYLIEGNLKERRYTMDSFAQVFTENTIRSVEHNAYYFAPLFSTTVVSPAAHNFVLAFMSNHSSTEPGGYLTESIFKSFFGVSGTYPNYKWLPGQERIPENWYRRPTLEPYNAVAGVFGDLVPTFAAYPDSFRFGGNTGGVGTYTGISLSDFTGGVINGSNLLEGNNLACFVIQNIQQGAPDAIIKGPNPLDIALPLLKTQLGKSFASLTSCPQIQKFNDNLLNNYPGHKYSPKPGAATNC